MTPWNPRWDTDYERACLRRIDERETVSDFSSTEREEAEAMTQLCAEYARRMQVIEALCRRHAHPGSNSGAHRLACEVLKIIRGESDA